MTAPWENVRTRPERGQVLFDHGERIGVIDRVEDWSSRFAKSYGRAPWNHEGLMLWVKLDDSAQRWTCTYAHRTLHWEDQKP